MNALQELQARALNDIVSAGKYWTMVDNGYQLHEILTIKEVEFTYEHKTKLVTEMEIWTDTNRTKGHKRLTPHKKTQKMIGEMMEAFNQTFQLNL